MRMAPHPSPLPIGEREGMRGGDGYKPGISVNFSKAKVAYRRVVMG